VLIGWIEEIVYYQGRYYILDRQQKGIQVFDDKGKFIFQLNKRGQGPGEYSELRSIYLNPFTSRIDILDLSVIHSYDLSGKHVKKYPPPTNSTIFFNSFVALNEKHMCYLREAEEKEFIIIMLRKA